VAKTVFISYRQLSDAQKARVKTFAVSLRDAGVTVVLDQFYLDDNPGGPPDTWAKWSTQNAHNAECILIIGNDEWFRCFDGTEEPGTGLGAAAEGVIVRNRLYQGAGSNPSIRVALFDRADGKHISPELKGFHKFQLPGHLPAIIAWLGGTAPGSVTSPVTGFAWPNDALPFTPDMANRTDEFTFFASTLTSGTSKRGTLISAEPGRGKSHLFRNCYSYAKTVVGQHRCARVDFRGLNSTQYLFDCLKSDLGGHFSTCGEGSLVDCLKAAREPVVIALDHYENATVEARSHVESLLLGSLERAPNVRLLLAGQPQAFPSRGSSNWEEDIQRYELDVINDVKCWIDWTRARGYDLVTDDMVRTLVIANQGNPSTISAGIQTIGGKPPDYMRGVGFTHLPP
jgi:hypothetical protein